MRHRATTWVIPILVVTVFTGTTPLRALPVPSKTAAGQSLAERQAELASVRQVFGQEQVAEQLESHGFTRAEVEQRLAELSPQEIHTLSQHLDQLQAAGLNPPEYIWVLLAVFLGVLIASAIF